LPCRVNKLFNRIDTKYSDSIERQSPSQPSLSTADVKDSLWRASEYRVDNCAVGAQPPALDGVATDSQSPCGRILAMSRSLLNRER
jgi:hypothetical protein